MDSNHKSLFKSILDVWNSYSNEQHEIIEFCEWFKHSNKLYTKHCTLTGLIEQYEKRHIVKSFNGEDFVEITFIELDEENIPKWSRIYL